MLFHLLEVAVLILLAGFGALVAFVRHGLRPRRARLDPALTELPVETVAIVSLSGATLAGWFVAGDGRGGVLLLHGAKSNRLTHIERMRTRHNAGYSTLAIDFQAHGESPGNRITLGQREALDARSALEWMRARMPGEGLAALGVSMGGAAALIGGPIRTDALIVESIFPDLALSLQSPRARDWRSSPRGDADSPFGSARLLLLALRVAAGIDRRRMRPIEAIGRFHAPILVLTGAEDVKATREESRALFARANPPKFYWEAPAAGHIDLAYAGGEAYWERVLGFLASTLRASSVSQR